jgi:hypothetical protein
MSVLDDASDAYEEAVRCRACGIGLVPIEVIQKLTWAEWVRIRVMDQPEARRLVRALDMEPVIVIERSREDVDHGH